jgi:hypothetical protein
MQIFQGGQTADGLKCLEGCRQLNGQKFSTSGLRPARKGQANKSHQ